LGFKPGGFTPFIDPPQSPKFGTETLWASEIGVKSAWLAGKLTANVALFYYDVTDYQVEQFAPVGFDIIVANAKKARSVGAELEVTTRPAAGWELSAFAGYTDARLERFTDPFTGATAHDTHPPFAAEFNAGLSAQYKDKSGLLGRIAYAAVGDTFHDAANTSAFKQSAYGLLNARVGFEREHFGIFLFGENLTDTEYFSKKIPPLNGGAPGRPQMLGVMLVARY
jgi:iron complex outermembrane receptor protein